MVTPFPKKEGSNNLNPKLLIIIYILINKN